MSGQIDIGMPTGQDISLEPWQWVLIKPGTPRIFGSDAPHTDYAFAFIDVDGLRLDPLPNTKQIIPPHERPIVDRLLDEAENPPCENARARCETDLIRLYIDARRRMLQNDSAGPTDAERIVERAHAFY